MWSDPDEIDNWAISPRGAGWLFGENVTREVIYALLTPLYTTYLRASSTTSTL